MIEIDIERRSMRGSAKVKNIRVSSLLQASIDNAEYAVEGRRIWKK